MKRRNFGFMLFAIVLLSQNFSTVYAQFMPEADKTNFRLGGGYYSTQQDCASVPTANLTPNTGAGANPQGGLSAKLMSIKDPAKFGSAIDQWIAKKQPSSPLTGMGQWAVKGGMRAGINPILPIIIANVESQLGTSKNGGDYSVTHNYYGRMATASQPHVTTNRMWYKWDSSQASLYDPAGGSSTDMYLYLKAVYSAEIEQGITAVMMKYAPPSENDTSAYIKTLQNTAQEIYTLAGDSIDQSQLGAVLDLGGTTTSTSCAGTTSNSMTDISINGMVIYYQTDPSWGSHSYAGDSIALSGCGPTSTAMLVSTLTGKQVTPDTMADFFTANGGVAASGGSSWALFANGSALSKTYGVRIQDLGTDMSKVASVLQSGGLVLMSQGKGFWTSGGHILTIRGMTSSGNYLVGDPISKTKTTNEAGYPLSKFVSPEGNLMHLWAFYKV